MSRRLRRSPSGENPEGFRLKPALRTVLVVQPSGCSTPRRMMLHLRDDRGGNGERPRLKPAPPGEHGGTGFPVVSGRESGSKVTDPLCSPFPNPQLGTVQLISAFTSAAAEVTRNRGPRVHRLREQFPECGVRRRSGRKPYGWISMWPRPPKRCAGGSGRTALGPPCCTVYGSPRRRGRIRPTQCVAAGRQPVRVGDQSLGRVFAMPADGTNSGFAAV